jgi:hypothetical protein
VCGCTRGRGGVGVGAGGDGAGAMGAFGVLGVFGLSSAAALFPVAVSIEGPTLLASKFARESALGMQAAGAVMGGALLAVNLNLSELILIKRTSALATQVLAVVKVVLVCPPRPTSVLLPQSLCLLRAWGKRETQTESLYNRITLHPIPYTLQAKGVPESLYTPYPTPYKLKGYLCHDQVCREDANAFNPQALRHPKCTGRLMAYAFRLMAYATNPIRHEPETHTHCVTSAEHLGSQSHHLHVMLLCWLSAESI